MFFFLNLEWTQKENQVFLLHFLRIERKVIFSERCTGSFGAFQVVIVRLNMKRGLVIR